MSDDVIKFSCHQCGQHIRAFTEHIGQTLMCPSCKGMITVPPNSETPGEEEALVVVRKFSDEELNLIRREGTGAYEAYIGGAVRKYWQFALMADLLTKRLRPLQQSVLDIMRQQTVYEREVVTHSQFVKFIDEKAEEFFSILFQLCDRMTDDLDRVLYQDNLHSIIGFANQMGAIVLRLKTFHDSIFERPLPQEPPYTELQGAMKSWAPFCWQSLNNVIEELRSLSVRKQDDSSWKAVQMSFAPPTLHEFYYHKLTLPEPEPDIFSE